MNADGSRAIGTRAAENVYDAVVRRGEQWIDRAYVVRDWYITAYEPIRDYGGAIIGMLYVGLLEGKYVEVRRRTVLVFLAVTLAGSLLALTLSHYLSQRISGSLEQLVAGAEQLARGNLDQRVEIRSGDEFQELAETFNVMAAALKQRDEQLKEQAARKVMESERLAMIGQLAAGVAHEINNPLHRHRDLLAAAAGEEPGRGLHALVAAEDRHAGEPLPQDRPRAAGLLAPEQARRAAVQREHGAAGVRRAGGQPGAVPQHRDRAGTSARTCRWCRWTRRRSSRSS